VAVVALAVALVGGGLPVVPGGLGAVRPLVARASGAPVVTALDLHRGPTAGNTLVTVQGTGFTGASGVSFGGAAGSGLTVSSDSVLTVRSPGGQADGSTVDVTVTTPGGTSTAGAADRFSFGNYGPYVPVPITRIADTRGDGTSGQPYSGQHFGSGVPPRTTLDVQVSGLTAAPSKPTNVPDGRAAAVVVNLTVINYTSTPGDYLTVWPKGAAQPATSNVNVQPNQTIAALVEVGVGSGGMITIYNYTSVVDVIVDVQGYVATDREGPAGLFNPTVASRIMDTRVGSTPAGGVCPGSPGNVCPRPNSDQAITVQVAGQGGIPASGVQSVIIDLLVLPSAAGFAAVYPQGSPRPAFGSNLNFVAGHIVANRVRAELGASGQLMLYNYGGADDYVIDVEGWFTDAGNSSGGGLFHVLPSSRVVDTTGGNHTGQCAPNYTPSTCNPVGASDEGVLLGGLGGVPTGASAVTLNLTVVYPSAQGWFIVYPADAARPNTTDVYFQSGQTIANLDGAKLSSDGKVKVYNSLQTATPFIVDVDGYYLAPAAPGAPTAVAATPGPSSARVSWAAPTSGSPATAYTVSAYVNGQKWSDTPVANATTANVAGLKNTAAYTFTVTATNPGGAGTSAPSAAITPAAPSGGGLGNSFFPWDTTCCPGVNGWQISAVSQYQLPVQSTWTVEGYIWNMSYSQNTGDHLAWGVLQGTPASPNTTARAGIQWDVPNAPVWVWPGGSNPSGLSAALFTSASPVHLALEYDGSYVYGFVGGVEQFAQAATGATWGSGDGAVGVTEGSMVRYVNYDEFSEASTSLYANVTHQAPFPAQSFTPPTHTIATGSDSTQVLYHFDDYGAGKLPPFSFGGCCNLPTSNQALALFGDSSQKGGGRDLNLLANYYCGVNCVANAYETMQPISAPPGVPLAELLGGGLPWICTCSRATPRPVNTATGEFWHTIDDLAIPGRGPALDFAQTYSSFNAGLLGRLGYGWSDSYNLAFDPLAGVLHAANGSSTQFTAAGGVYTPPPGVQGSLVKNAGPPVTYVFTDKARTASTFDATGRLTAITDRNGYTTTLAYNGGGQLATVTDAAGRALTLAYKPGTNLLQSVTDPASPPRSVSFQYDGANQLTQVTDVKGGHWAFTYTTSGGVPHLLQQLQDQNCTATPSTCSYTTSDGGFAGVANVYDGAAQPRVLRQYDGLGRLTAFAYAASGPEATTTVTDPRGNQTVDEYMFNMLTAQTRGAGSAQAALTTYRWDSSSLGLSQVGDPNGGWTTFTRDAQGNVLTSTDPLGRTTTSTYNSFAEPLTVQDPLLVTTTNVYDANGNLTQTSRPLAGTSQTMTLGYAYQDSAHPGDLTQVTDADGKLWHFTYDAYGDLASATDPLGDRTTHFYDGIGRQTSMVTPDGNVSGGTPANFTWSYQVDNLYQRTRVTDPPPLSHATQLAYDPNENLLQTTDPAGKQTTNTYDADNQLTKVTRPDTSTLQTTYDGAGNVTAQTDGLTHQTTYTYDALNRQTSVSDPLGRLTTYAYDSAGNRTRQVDATNQPTFFQFDPANQPVAVLYPDGATPRVAFTYDADGQRLTMLDGTGATVSAWDSLHRLTDQTNGAGAHLGFSYDLKGQLTSIAYPGATGSVSRGFDDAGRLHTIADWLGHSTTVNYDPSSNLTQILYPNGVTGTFTPDNSDRTMAISYTSGGNTLLGLSYSRDSLNRLTSEGSTSYGYDPTSRLSNFNSPSTPNYAYDAADHPTQLASLTQAYDSADQLCWSATTGSSACASPPAGATTFSFDSRGNRLTRTTSGSTTNLTYDSANRLVAYGPTATYAYDGDGKRMAKTISGATTQQTWNTSAALPLLLQDGSVSYVTGPADLPLEQISGSSVLYCHEDQLGSVRLLTNSSGLTAGSASYDPFGNPSSTGASTPFGFASQYTDSESGLVYLRARFYDPATAQFLSRDPMVATTRSAYGYVRDNPLNATDPSGLMCLAFWDSSKCSNPLTQVLGGMVGAGMTASADAGNGYGAVGSSTGFDNWPDVVHGSDYTASYGGFVVPASNNGWTAGAQASAGFHGSFTNAHNSAGVLGCFHNFNINLGAIIDVSLTYSWSDSGTWVITPQIGPGVGASVSSYDTNTVRGGH
jgi:RHS repeat-associated protein